MLAHTEGGLYCEIRTANVSVSVQNQSVKETEKPPNDQRVANLQSFFGPSFFRYSQNARR